MNKRNKFLLFCLFVILFVLFDYWFQKKLRTKNITVQDILPTPTAPGSKYKQCPAMYIKTQKKLIQNKDKESRPPPFWLTKEIKENHLFVTNTGNIGRLGNKLFEFAGVFGVANHNNRTPVIKQRTQDALRQYFDIRIDNDGLVENTSDNLTFRERECHTRMNETMNLPQGNVTIGTYLLSRLYFENAEEELRKELMFKDAVMEAARKFLNQSLPLPLSETTFARVVIHVRRSDLLMELSRIQGFTDLKSDYFSRSMTYFKQCYDKVQFVVITDDISWCKQNIVGPDVIYSAGTTPGVDLALSSLCDHAITTFGTFTIWSAWFANGITVRPANSSQQNSKAFHFLQLEEESFPVDVVKL